MPKKPEKINGKNREREHVRNRLDIAMEKAEAMAGPSAGGEDKGREASLPEAELDELRGKAARADEYYEGMLRAAAELDNYRKRVEREKQDLARFGQEQLMSDLIRVLDNYERARDAAEKASEIKDVVDGVKLIEKQLLAALRRNGLEQIEAVGKPFNPELHEAVSQVETDEYPEGTVVSEQLKGYTLNGRLLRPSAVTVSKPPKP